MSRHVSVKTHTRKGKRVRGHTRKITGSLKTGITNWFSGVEKCSYCGKGPSTTRVAGKPACKLCGKTMRAAGEKRRTAKPATTTAAPKPRKQPRCVKCKAPVYMGGCLNPKCGARQPIGGAK